MTEWEQIIDSFAGAQAIEAAAALSAIDKVCSACKAALPRSEFYHKSGRSQEALISRCKTCFKADQRNRKQQKKARPA